MNKRYFVGIQGAAKNARLAACDETGRVLSCIEVGPLGLRVNTDFKQAFNQACSRLASQLGFPSIAALSEATDCLCVAMSGVFQDGDRFAVRHTLEDIGFVGRSQPVICEDVWAVVAAEGLNSGATVMACTGSNVFIRNTAETFVTIGGWGSELGDLGSGFHIGKMAIYRILEAVDERRVISPTFTSAILDSLSLDTATQLVPWYHELRNTSYWRSTIADIAITVTALAEQGVEKNPTAVEIIDLASHEFTVSMKAGFRRAAAIGILTDKDPFPVVLSGGLGIASRSYWVAVQKGLTELKVESVPAGSGNGWPEWNLKRAGHHPIIGALAMALSRSKTVLNDGALSELFASKVGEYRS